MPTNAAFRIRVILEKAAKFQPNRPTVHAWANALGVEPNRDIIAPLLVDMLLELKGIEEQVLNTFTANKTTVLLKFFPEIRRAIGFESIDGSWDPAAKLLTPQALYSLETLEHEIEEEPQIAPYDLQEIRRQVDELFHLVGTSDINKKLRNWIMSWLSAIKQAIDRFDITGVKALQDALIRIQGEANIFAPAIEVVKKQSPDVFERFKSTFDFICKATDVVDRCRRLSESPTGVYLADVTLRLLSILPS